MLVSINLVLTTVVVTAILWLTRHVVKFFLHLRKITKACEQFPSQPRHWFWGTILDMPNDFGELQLEYFRQMAAKYPRCLAVYRTAFAPTLSVRHPDLVKIILKRSDPKANKSPMYRIGLPWLGDGLILSSGAKWKRMRRLLTPAFHYEILQKYTNLTNNATDIFLEKLEKCSNENSVLDVSSNLSLLTLDVILRSAMGYEDGIQDSHHPHQFSKNVTVMSDLWCELTLSIAGQFQWLSQWTSKGREFNKACNYVRGLARSVIANRKKAIQDQGDSMFDTNTSKCQDFLDLLLIARDEDGVGLTDYEILDEVVVFMFAGHDTTASAITWTLYALATHPEYQEKCREEIDEVTEGRNENNITWDDLPRLKYLTMCLKEAQRRYVPVPFIAREMAEPVTLDGKVLPVGTTIEINMYAVHHNPTVWEDDMVYKPDRFLPENIDKMDTFAFVPFSAGPRNCLGQTFSTQEQKIVVAKILRKYVLELTPNFEVKPRIGVVMRPAEGLYLKIREHDNDTLLPNG